MSNWQKIEIPLYFSRKWWEFWVPKKALVTMYVQGELDISNVQVEIER